MVYDYEHFGREERNRYGKSYSTVKRSDLALLRVCGMLRNLSYPLNHYVSFAWV